MLSASEIGKRRALATTTIAGFRSRPIEWNAWVVAAKVVVPLPFHGSSMIDPLGRFALDIISCANASGNPA
jgi:hypothetical protein